MSKIEDVTKIEKLFITTDELFGGTPECLTTFVDYFQKLGLAICEEQGVDLKTAPNLPMDTLLGEKSEPIFTDLKKWLRTQHSTFHDL
jgi:hypothetical protein